MSKSTNSFGLSKENAELFEKVQFVIGNMSEREIANNPEKIYGACKKSNKFSVSELEILSSVYKEKKTESLIEMIIKILKKLFK